MTRRTRLWLVVLPIAAGACSEHVPPAAPPDSTKVAASVEGPRCFWDVPRSRDDAEVVASVDRLSAVTDLPYICSDLCRGGPGCGDALFWKVVRDGKLAIPYLVDQLDDATSTGVSVPNFGGKYAVGDVALTALEIIVDVPHEALVGVTQSADCGECAWWKFVRASRENRELLERSVRRFLSEHEERLAWGRPAHIPWLDCVENCEHPAGGSFSVAPSE